MLVASTAEDGGSGGIPTSASSLCSPQSVAGFLQRWHTLGPHAEQYSRVIKGNQRLLALPGTTLFISSRGGSVFGSNRARHQTTAMMKVVLDTRVSLSPPCRGMKPGAG